MILREAHIPNDRCSQFTMRFHDFKFFIRQFSRFVQYFFRNTDLTDVMKRRSRCDQSNICLCQMISIRYCYQFSKHQFRRCFDMQDMFAALTVTGSQYITQDPDHNIIIFFFFVNLINNYIDQTFLGYIKIQCILHSFFYNNSVKRPCNIICNSHFICFAHHSNRFFRRDHNYRCFIDTLTFVHHFQNFKTIHLWHMDIQKYQIDSRMISYQLNGLISVFSFQIMIRFSENLL